MTDIQLRPAACSAAGSIAADLARLEEAIGLTMRLTHSIGQTLHEGQAAARISATFGQAMFDDVAAVIGAGTSLRGQVVQMHNRMERHARRLGIETTAGGLEKPPETNGPESPWRPAARKEQVV